MAAQEGAHLLHHVLRHAGQPLGVREVQDRRHHGAPRAAHGHPISRAAEPRSLSGREIKRYQDTCKHGAKRSYGTRSKHVQMICLYIILKEIYMNVYIDHNNNYDLYIYLVFISTYHP